MTPNLRPFLDMIAVSEIGTTLLEKSNNGYNVIVGSTPGHPVLFNDYSDHPRVKVDLGRGLFSTAAGRYQILARYYDSYKTLLGLTDFSPASQDAIAAQMIKERGALMAISVGDIRTAIVRCKNIWASLPGAGYGQHENRLEDLRTAYINAGGAVAGGAVEAMA